MKLALALTDQSFAATKSVGIFNVSMGLARGLMACPEVTELHLLGNAECAEAFRDLPPHVHVHLLDKPVPSRFARVWWDQWGVCSAVRRIAPDWVLLPKGFPPFFPRFGGAKLACYLHDVNWEYYEARGQMADSPFPSHQLAYFRTLGLRALKVADLVLTSTRFNIARFAAHVPQARCEAVGIGFDGPEQPAQATGSARDILFYASPYPHKLTRLGLARLAAWMQAQGSAAEGLRVHIIGRLPQGVSLPDSRYIAHGRLPQAELDRLLREQCRVALYFSDYEGFGMPPVECLRAGVPCVASDLPPIRENIPARYLFANEDEATFLRVFSEAYAGTAPLERPAYPTWQEVAGRAVQAMTGVAEKNQKFVFTKQGESV